MLISILPNNDGISQLLADDHNNEQNHDNVVSSNNQQDMTVNENVIQVNGTNICNQGVLEETLELPTLIAHLPMPMPTSTPEHSKQIWQLSMLMTIQIQMMMMIYWCALFVLKQ